MTQGPPSPPPRDRHIPVSAPDPGRASDLDGTAADHSHHRNRAALLGHDIRNAIADILGGLSMAASGAAAADDNRDSAQQDMAQQLERVRSAAEQLTRLTDEIVALAAGDTAASATASGLGLGLNDFLTRLGARWAAHAREKGAIFTLTLGSDLPDYIGTDRNALDRILTNVIGNAIKYGGDVTLGVDLHGQETLAFRIRDTGPGFSDGALARLFEQYGRTAENAQPGSGLGLHIVRNLVRQINGSIEIGNHPDGGAEVTLLLPRPAWVPGIGPDLADSALPDLAGRRVLVAEDNPTNQLLIRQMLETLGADCVLAADGQEALDRFGAQVFDLALIDIEMPRLSGIDLIRLMRGATGPKAEVPVLAITAFVLSANRQGIYEAGADGILAKPILSLESFGAAISKVIERRTKTPPGALDALAAPTPHPVDALHLDRLVALSGAAGGRELLVHLYRDFQGVQDDIRTGLDPIDAVTLRARTHVLISLAGALGASQLQELANQMNMAAHNKDTDSLRQLGPVVGSHIVAVTTQLKVEFQNRYGARIDDTSSVD